MEKRKIILVHSIKGGCGKTTISLALSKYFSKKKEKTCYLDADIVGYGTSKIFKNGQNSKKTFTDYLLVNPFGNKEFFITDLKDAKKELFLEYIISEDVISEDALKIIVASTEKLISEKAVRVTNDLFMQEEIKYKLHVLFSKLFLEMGVKTLIIDTTPGDQGLTAIIKEAISELNDPDTESPSFFKELFGDDKLETLNLYIATNHFAHIESLKREEFNEEKTQVVLNQIPIGFDFNKIPIMDELIQDLDTIDKEFGSSSPKGIDAFRKCIEENNETDSEAIRIAYRKYCIVMNNYYKSELISNSKIVLNIIPEVSSLRNHSADFFHGAKDFDKKDLFNTLDHEMENGHLKLLCEAVTEHFEKSNY